MDKAEGLKLRRNVLVLSSILILFDIARIEIDKFSILGTTLVVGRKELLMPFLLLLWFYFLVRYYQHFQMKRWKYFSGYLERRIKSYATHWARRKDKTTDEHQVSYEVTRRGILNWTVERNSGVFDSGSTIGPDTSKLPPLLLLVYVPRAFLAFLFVDATFVDDVFPHLLILMTLFVTVIPYLYSQLFA